MKNFIRASAGLMALVMASTIATSGALAEPPGITTFSVVMPHHQKITEMAVWYPVVDGPVVTVAENPVFHGVKAIKNGMPAAGRYPVILLSHGSGGNFRSQAWLAAGLAGAGAVVVAVNHPNSTTGDLDWKRAMHHGTRVADLSAALDAVMANPRFAGMIDATRIYAAGFSFGGWTALSMGGLRGNLAGYAKTCAKESETMSHCKDLIRAGVDLSAYSAAEWDASYRDPRVSKVAAVDPALTWGITDASGLVADAFVIGLGAGGDRLRATDTTAAGSGFDEKLPAGHVEVIAPAVHFSALPICKPEGAQILEDEHDDPVCTDPPGADRAAIHARVIAAMVRHFGLGAGVSN